VELLRVGGGEAVVRVSGRGDGGALATALRAQGVTVEAQAAHELRVRAPGRS
jgi:hypothetical protein